MFQVQVASASDGNPPIEFTPLSPAPKGCSWTGVTTSRQVTVRGGYYKKSLVVECKELERDDGSFEQYLHVGKSDDWLVKMVLGPGGGEVRLKGLGPVNA